LQYKLSAYKTFRRPPTDAYSLEVPKLWNTTVEEHRRTVHTAILDTTAALVIEHGMAVTMSQIAQHTGIGRATLYKYFKDVESIMVAWHERQVGEHLRQLNAAVAGCTDLGERLRTVLTVYADLSSTGRNGHEHSAHGERHPVDFTVPLHRAPHIHQAQRQVHNLVTEIIETAAGAGLTRTDVPAAELATYCLHALTAAVASPSRAARDRLVTVTLAGLQPPPGSTPRIAPA
jgi:AcrR family transcriptional regulator